MYVGMYVCRYVYMYVCMYEGMYPHISRNTEDTEMEKRHQKVSRIPNLKFFLNDV